MRFSQGFYLITVNGLFTDGIYVKEVKYGIRGSVYFKYLHSNNKLIIYFPMSTYSINPADIDDLQKCEVMHINHETIKYVFTASTIEIKKGS